MPLRRIALVADQFVPGRSSCAVQMRDLALELRDQGYQVTVIVPNSDQDDRWVQDDFSGVSVIRIKATETRDRNYLTRAVGEFVKPLIMRRTWSAELSSFRFDGIVWYSPSIFMGPFISHLKRRNGCPAYLILRDIFPEWAADVGLMRRGPHYRMLQAIARHQYSLADTIGVQTPANLAYFERDVDCAPNVEVLQNWLKPADGKPCSIDPGSGKLRGRRIFVYAGNMGAAQGMEKLLAMAETLEGDTRFGFLFVGRGSEAVRISLIAERSSNIEFHDEIDPDEIPSLYARCDVGLVALDARHAWHNIPGKFISYMHAGLPVLASVNEGNDLVDVITSKRVGCVSTEPQGLDLPTLAVSMLDGVLLDPDLQHRCRVLAENCYSAKAAARQIVTSLESTRS